MIKHLVVCGRITTKLILKYKLEATLNKPNNDWFFIKPTEWNFDKGFHFDMTLTEDFKKSKGFLSVRLMQVLDEHGSALNKGISANKKTICRFQFDDFIPRLFREMPLVNSWDSSSFKIMIASTKDIVPKVTIFTTNKH